MYLYGPKELVDMIGVENGYILIFLIAAFGGLSSVSSAVYYTTLFTLAAGGANPLLLGVLCGIAITIGDSAYFFFGESIRGIAPKRLHKILDKITHWIEKRPDWAAPLLVFIYTGFTPLPNDVLTVPLALAGVKYRKIWYALLLGNVVLMTILAYAAAYGVTFLTNIS